MDELTRLGSIILDDSDLDGLARLSGQRKAARGRLPAIREENHEEEDLLPLCTPAGDRGR